MVCASSEQGGGWSRGVGTPERLPGHHRTVFQGVKLTEKKGVNVTDNFWICSSLLTSKAILTDSCFCLLWETLAFTPFTVINAEARF